MFQVMAWRCIGDKPSPAAMMTSVQWRLYVSSTFNEFIIPDRFPWANEQRTLLTAEWSPAQT